MLSDYQWFIELLFWMPPTILAISWRESVKTWLCNYRGDSSAKRSGNLSFSLNNLDPTGSAIAPILLILSHSYVYAWAKPTDIRHTFLKGKQSDVIIIVCLGLLSNFVMAMGWSLIAMIGKTQTHLHPMLAKLLIVSGQAGIQINILLIAVHLIPLPPLDMSYVVRAFLPRYARSTYTLLDYIGHYIVFGLFLFDIGQSYIHPVYIGLVDQLHSIMHIF